MMRSRGAMWAKIQAPAYKPKFAKGERVKVSPEGVAAGIAKDGAIGTVEACLSVAVLIQLDGAPHAEYFCLDFWERPFFR